MTSSNFNDPIPEQRWYTQIQLAQDAWAAATNFVKKNRDHVIFNGCSPLDSPTGLNERRIVLFRMTAKKFSDVLGCRFKKQVDDYDDTDEGRLQQKRGRENLKLRMKHALGECNKRLSAVTYTRIVTGNSTLEEVNGIFGSKYQEQATTGDGSTTEEQQEKEKEEEQVDDAFGTGGGGGGDAFDSDNDDTQGHPINSGEQLGNTNNGQANDKRGNNEAPKDNVEQKKPEGAVVERGREDDCDGSDNGKDDTEAVVKGANDRATADDSEGKDPQASAKKLTASLQRDIVKLKKKNSAQLIEIGRLKEDLGKKNDENSKLREELVATRQENASLAATVANAEDFLISIIESEARDRKEYLKEQKSRYGHLQSPKSFFETSLFKPGHANAANDSDVGRKVAIHRQLLRIEAAEKLSGFKYGQKLDGRYLLSNMIGVGGQAEVWCAWDIVEFHLIALKVYRRASKSREAIHIECVKQEIDILDKSEHEHVVSYFRWINIDCDYGAAVLGYCSTNLAEILSRKGRLPEDEARRILVQIMSGMRYLSSNGVIHYDLKPGNILIDEDGNVKITDFGLSKRCKLNGCTTRIAGDGTYWYLPPECFPFGKRVEISNKVDVWSVGVIFFQMLFGQLPFGKGLSLEQIKENGIQDDEISSFPPAPEISEQAKSFISTSLTRDNLNRPFMEVLCNHTYLK